MTMNSHLFKLFYAISIKMRLVRQRHIRGCVVASVAMLTGRTYRDILPLFADQDIINTGITTGATRRVLHRLGYKMRRVARIHAGQPALLHVKSLNHRGEQHAIVYDGKKFFDPMRGTRGKRWYIVPGDDDIRHVYSISAL